MEQIVIDTFWKFVNKSDNCWQWKGKVTKGITPVFTIGKKEYSARRISCLVHDKQIEDGSQVFHTCENTLCVNPDHLICGNEARFFAKVQKLSESQGGCWIWISAEDKNGYGKFCFTDENGYQDVRAHRYSWEMRWGKISSPIVLVCHKCDNPRCVNPDHLFLGDNQDNVNDRDQKGRNIFGEKHPLSKINTTQVIGIKLYLLSEIPVSMISKLTGISTNTIYGIKYNATWKTVIL